MGLRMLGWWSCLFMARDGQPGKGFPDRQDTLDTVLNWKTRLGGRRAKPSRGKRKPSRGKRLAEGLSAGHGAEWCGGLGGSKEVRSWCADGYVVRGTPGTCYCVPSSNSGTKVLNRENPSRLASLTSAASARAWVAPLAAVPGLRDYHRFRSRPRVRWICRIAHLIEPLNVLSVTTLRVIVCLNPRLYHASLPRRAGTCNTMSPIIDGPLQPLYRDARDA